jgi:hypothetical protein
MSKVKVASFGMSIDGFSAGPRQSLGRPILGGGSMAGHMSDTRRLITCANGGSACRSDYRALSGTSAMLLTPERFYSFRAW